MVQWINVIQNNSFLNPTRLPLLCRNSRTITLMEHGLMASWLAGLLAGWQLAGWQTKWGQNSNFKNSLQVEF